MNTYKTILSGLRLVGIALSAFAILATFNIAALADEGHSFQGSAGFTASFYLIGGEYRLYVNASFPFSGSAFHRSCNFSGNFSRLSPTQDTLHIGGPAPISSGMAYTLDRTPVSLPAGLYRLHISPATDCRWKFWVTSTPQNSTGIASVQMVIFGGNSEPTATVSLHDKVRFSADVRTENNRQETWSGVLQIIYNGEVVRSTPLQLASDPPVRGEFSFVDIKWEPADAKYVGKNTAKFVAKIGDREYVSTGEFTLTP